VGPEVGSERRRRRHRRVERTRGRAQDARDVVVFAAVAAWACAASVCTLVPGYGWLAPLLAGLVGAGAVATALIWRVRRRHRGAGGRGAG
jgi:CHASE2 domain-containing sensor protein